MYLLLLQIYAIYWGYCQSECLEYCEKHICLNEFYFEQAYIYLYNLQYTWQHLYIIIITIGIHIKDITKLNYEFISIKPAVDVLVHKYILNIEQTFTNKINRIGHVHVDKLLGGRNIVHIYVMSPRYVSNQKPNNTCLTRHHVNILTPVKNSNDKSYFLLHICCLISLACKIQAFNYSYWYLEVLNACIFIIVSNNQAMMKNNTNGIDIYSRVNKRCFFPYFIFCHIVIN